MKRFKDGNVDERCFKPVQNCPEGLATCSAFKGVDPISDSCRLWFADLKTDRERDAVMENYCFRYNTTDCRCVNRSNTREYRELKKGNVIDDKCWFLPCANPERYFVTSDLQQGTCPNNVCEIIYDIYKDRDVSIYNNDMVCDMSGSGAGILLDFIKHHWPIILATIAIFGMAYSYGK